jgi:hypothetical protein
MQFVNPFDLESEVVESLPELQWEGMGWQVFLYDDEPYLLYQHGDSYRLRDLTRNVDSPALDWLKTEPIDFFEKSVEVVRNGEVRVRINRPDGVSVSRPLSPKDLTGGSKNAAALQTLVMPPEIAPVGVGLLSNSPWGVVVVSEANHGLWFDYSSNEVRDYCLPGAGSWSVSVDGRYAATTYVELPNPLPLPKTTWIIDLDTGYRAKLDGWEAVGWAQNSP